eukprot:4053824-Prymnesium_polylepis.1
MARRLLPAGGRTHPLRRRLAAARTAAPPRPCDHTPSPVVSRTDAGRPRQSVIASVIALDIVIVVVIEHFAFDLALLVVADVLVPLPKLLPRVGVAAVEDEVTVPHVRQQPALRRAWAR